MAEKEVHVTRDGGGVGTGLIAGILVALLVVVGLIFVAGGLDFERDVNVNLEAPKVDAPNLDAPKVDVPKPDGS